MRICIDCGETSHDDALDHCPTCAGATVPLRDTGDTLVGRVLGGRYALLKKLGEGGMGMVYAARHLKLDQVVAIKLMRFGTGKSDEPLRRFYAEAKNTSRLKHPNNIRIFDFGHTEDGHVYIVMELIDGQPLTALPRPLGPVRAIRIAIQIASALDEAHELGLVHRDLKPDNVMISRIDRKNFVRVLDYGIAKLADSSKGLTATNAFIGTPDYTSPEQIDGPKVDRRCDIYLLGIILYEMLVGELPFRADRPLGVLYKHKMETAPSPRRRADISVELDALILNCLAKSPDDRPATMRDVVERLELLPEVENLSMSGTAPAFDRSRVRTETRDSGEISVEKPRDASGDVATTVTGPRSGPVFVENTGTRPLQADGEDEAAVEPEGELEPAAGPRYGLYLAVGLVLGMVLATAIVLSPLAEPSSTGQESTTDRVPAGEGAVPAEAERHGEQGQAPAAVPAASAGTGGPTDQGGGTGGIGPNEAGDVAGVNGAAVTEGEPGSTPEAASIGPGGAAPAEVGGVPVPPGDNTDGVDARSDEDRGDEEARERRRERERRDEEEERGRRDPEDDEDDDRDRDDGDREDDEDDDRDRDHGDREADEDDDQDGPTQEERRRALEEALDADLEPTSDSEVEDQRQQLDNLLDEGL